MTNELDCLLNDTPHEYYRRESLQGKNVGNAHVYKASLFFLTGNKIQYLLKIFENLRSIIHDT